MYQNPENIRINENGSYYDVEFNYYLDKENSTPKDAIEFFKDRTHKIYMEDLHIGDIYLSRIGRLYKIVKMLIADDILIQYLDNGHFKHVTMRDICRGDISEGCVKHVNPEYFKSRIGEIYKSSNGDRFKIIDFQNGQFLVELLDGLWKGAKKYISTEKVKDGTFVTDLYTLNYYGEYVGQGFSSYDSRLMYKIYNIWLGILDRTSHFRNEKYPNYVDVYLCPDWYNFQEFAFWYIHEKINLNPFIDDYDVDKDFKQIGKYPKYYSPDTCMLIDPILNQSISGIYKPSKNCLAVGVYYSPRYRCYGFNFKDDGHVINSVHYATEEDAFEEYRKLKLHSVKKLASYCYYEKGTILMDDYHYIINNFDILPYNN